MTLYPSNLNKLRINTVKTLIHKKSPNEKHSLGLFL
jgi:hypothetical protein